MTTDSIRLFFALWPDKETRKQVKQFTDQLQPTTSQGRRVTTANLHMTLHFIGNTSKHNMQCLDQQASRVTGSPFFISLDTFGFFKKPKIIWLGCKQIPKPLFNLQHKLGKQLTCCDFQPEKRAFQPHVTLYRKSLVTDWPEFAPLQWHIKHFSLIKTLSDKSGVIYQEIARYPLRANADK